MKEYSLHEASGMLKKDMVDVARDIRDKEVPYRLDDGVLYVSHESLEQVLGYGTPVERSIKRREERNKRKRSRTPVPEQPDWIRVMQDTYGRTRLNSAIDSYGSAHVEGVVDCLKISLGDEGAVSVLSTDIKDTILKLKNSHLSTYMGSIHSLKPYVDSGEEEYDPKINPEKFLPNNIGVLVSSLNDQINGVDEEEKDNGNYQDLKIIFKNWDGRANNKFKRVLGKHGLQYIARTGSMKHPRIRKKDNPDEWITFASTPSDHRSGMNMALSVIRELLNN